LLSSLFIINCVGLFLELERVANDTYNLQVTDVICDSLNYVGFLNILCTVLFYFKYKRL
jgi:hypothetical protein